MPISETRPEPWAWLEGVDANGSPVKLPIPCDGKVLIPFDMTIETVRFSAPHWIKIPGTEIEVDEE